MLDGQTAPYYMVFDSSSEDLVKLLDKGLVTKHVFKADSIKDLASRAGLAQLEKSFEEYQEAAELGEDRAFGKTRNSCRTTRKAPTTWCIWCQTS